MDINVKTKNVPRTARSGRIYTNSNSSSNSSTQNTNGSNDWINLKNKPFIDVREFSAVGDGLTDNSKAIQSALDYCNTLGGGTIYIPAGEYKLSTGLKCYTNTIIKGDGRETTKLSSINYGDGGSSFGDGTANSSVMFYFVDADNVVISDLWFRGVGIDGSSCQGIEFDLLENGNTAHIMLNNLYVTDI